VGKRNDKLFLRALQILDGKATGLGMPILRHLAFRRYGPAMLDLAARQTRTGFRNELGRIWDPASSLGLTYRAFRMGEPHAAQNMAMSFYNVGDLKGYRHWLHRAAQDGDLEASIALRSCDIRQPHALARRLRRLRPYRRNGS
jgi:hypothetical protein